jgi:serpin B
VTKRNTHAAGAARTNINQWVDDKTRQKIRDLIPPGGLDAETRLVLVNAVYFKGKWVFEFRKVATRDEPFYVEGGGKVQAPLMHQQQEIRYLQAKGYQAVDLDYRGGDLSLLVLLPDRKDGLGELERDLSVETINGCVAGMGVREVNLFLPRFKMTWGTADICDLLKALGMTLAPMRGRGHPC